MLHAPEFLGWERPALESAADALLARHLGPTSIDLSGVRVVLPGARAGRMLLAILVDRATAARRPLLPPTMHTPGEIPTLALGSLGRPASPLTRALAWTLALEQTPEDAQRRLFVAPSDASGQGMAGIARLLMRASDTLAGGMLRFADVPGAAASLPDFPDEDRWLAAALVQRRHESILAEQGLVDDHLARIDALRAGRAPGAASITLVGVPELTRIAAESLRVHGGPVTPMVFAPANLADRFDSLGCVIPERWATALVDLPEGTVRFADSPSDQAALTLETLAALEGRFSPDQITLGAPDESVIPFLERAAEVSSPAPVRAAAGVPIATTPPCRLLALLADFLDRADFASFAALVRHPDMENALCAALGAGTETWLDALDRMQTERLPRSVNAAIFESAEARASGASPAFFAAFRGLIEPLGTPGDAAPRRPVGAWAEPLLDALRRVLGARQRDTRRRPDRVVVEACDTVRDALIELERASQGPLARLERSCPDTLRLLLAHLESAAVPEPPDSDAIEALGWLELALDPAPVTIVTGMHEGAVPRSTLSDPLLPDSLRRALRLEHDATRAARDAFLLASLAGSRDHLTLIAGRMDEAGEPLRPSRLLFQCEDERALETARRFADPASDPARVRVRSGAPLGGADRFRDRPKAKPLPLESVGVTAFRDWFASPYLFYLRHALGLEERDDAAPELDARGFGILLHDALSAFGAGPHRDETDAQRIGAHVTEALRDVALRRFGPDPAPAVTLQIELARQRLRAFAAWQSERRRLGWVIKHVEWPPQGDPAHGGVPLDIPGETSVLLRGRIDRIDYRATDDAFALLDYKTSDKSANPDAAHRKRDGSWRDLQLPLYSRLAASILGASGRAFGYIAIPRSGLVRDSMATWSDDDLRSAEEQAREIVRRARAGDLDDLGPKPASEGAFGAISGSMFLANAPADEPAADEDFDPDAPGGDADDGDADSGEAS